MRWILIFIAIFVIGFIAWSHEHEARLKAEHHELF